MVKEKQFAVVLGVVVNAKGEILIAKRHQPDIPELHGKLEFPGGGIDFGETPEHAVIREVKEESGLDVEIVRLLPQIYSNIWKREEGIDQAILISYECRVVGGELSTADEEISELKFMKANEIDYSQALPKTKEIIDLLNH